MPYTDESRLMGMDAPHDTSTQLCFDPPEGPFGDENVVKGSIDPENPNDEDWIVIKLTEGHMYTITVGGGNAAEGGLNDSVLKLLDAKGNVIEMNDDKDAMKGDLSSEIKGFMPEAGTGTQVYYISVSGYTGNPGANNTGAYTVRVSEVAVLPVGAGGDIVAVDDDSHKLTGTSNAEKIVGKGGDDTLDGMGGDDELNGGGGNDLLIGGKGADKLTGGDEDGAGTDTISYRGSAAGVTINLSDGTARGGDAEGDTIGNDIENVIGSEHDDMLTGSRAVNSLWGLGGNDDLDGGRRDDKLYGGTGDDTLDGGAGNDELEGGYGADMLTGGDGNDTASYSMSMMGVTVRLHSGQAMRGDAEGDTWNLSVSQAYTNNDEEEVEVNLADIINLTGSANDDILAGDMRNNTIMGGPGDDRIYGGPNPADAHKTGSSLTNADKLYGDGGNDSLFGGAGDDMLYGGAGDDHLWGNGGADTYYGGAGSDMIYASADDVDINGYDDIDDDTSTSDVDERVDGVMDIDTVSYEKLEEAVTRQLNTSATEISNPTAAGGATIINVENIIGSQGDDTLTGSADANVIEGGEGGDTLAGGGGIDTLSYASSDDWVRVTLGDGTAEATASRGHASGDKATNFENLTGSRYDDDLTGNGGDNVLKGLGGDDEIEGGGGNDTIEGGAGADELDGGYTPTDDAGEVAGTRPDDDGNRNFQTNTLSYATSNAGVTVNLTTASADGGHASGDTIVTYEENAPTEDDPNNEIDVATFVHVTGSMYGDRLTGNHWNNHLTGGGGDDTLKGGAGIDRVIGGPGADVLDGGEDMGERNDMVPDPEFDDTRDEDETNPKMIAASIDWAVYKHAEEGVTVDLSTGMGTGGEAMGDTLMNIELIWGSEHADTFIASSGGDIIEGDGGSDTVSYEASEMGVTVNLATSAHHTTVQNTGTGVVDDPDIEDDEADPVMFPTTDPESTDAGAASTLAGVPRLDKDGDPFTAAGGDNAEHEDDNPNANGAAGDKLRSIENLTGSNHKDMLTGDANPNVLKGMGGDDILVGGDETEDGDVGDKLYGGDGDDDLTGGGGEDMLSGGAGDDTLDGGTENDILTGGAGDDDLRGGAGTNTFVFSPHDGSGSDVILDWDTGSNNRIDLSAFGLTKAQVIGAIGTRGEGDNSYVVINLEAHGGGRITIDDITADELEGVFDMAEDDQGTDADETNDDIIQELNVYDATTNDDGVFILG